MYIWCIKFKHGRTALNDDAEKHGGDQGPRALVKIVSFSKV
jgi:hypothetical protein